MPPKTPITPATKEPPKRQRPAPITTDHNLLRAQAMAAKSVVKPLVKNGGSPSFFKPVKVIPVKFANFDIQNENHRMLLVDAVLNHFRVFSELSSIPADEKNVDAVNHYAKHIHLFCIVNYCILYVENYSIVDSDYLSRENLDSLRSVRDALLNILLDDKHNNEVEKIYRKIAINFARILCGLFSVDRVGQRYLLNDEQASYLGDITLLSSHGINAQRVRIDGIGDEFNFNKWLRQLSEYAIPIAILTHNPLSIIIKKIKADWLQKICNIYQRLRDPEQSSEEDVEALYSLLLYCGAAFNKMYQHPYFDSKRSQGRSEGLIKLLDTDPKIGKQLYEVLYDCYKKFYFEIMQCQIEVDEKFNLHTIFSSNRVDAIWEAAKNINAIFNPARIAQAAPPARLTF